MKEKNKIEDTRRVMLSRRCSASSCCCYETTKKPDPEQQHLRVTLRGAFTLIELLVVVLIIGILAAIALPQYEKAVWKSRYAEIAMNVKTIQNCLDIYQLENGLPNSVITFQNLGCSAELSGGSWQSDQVYKTKYFWYTAGCQSNKCYMEVRDKPSRTDDVTFVLNDLEDSKVCYTQKKPLGRVLCKIMEDQGWKYEDSDW